jgi:hypothetical protein
LFADTAGLVTAYAEGTEQGEGLRPAAAISTGSVWVGQVERDYCPPMSYHDVEVSYTLKRW